MAKATPVKKSAAKKVVKSAAAQRKPHTSTRKKTTVIKKSTAAQATGRRTPALKKVPAAKVKPGKKAAAKKSKPDMTRYRCRLCGYVYSPLRGEPHNGIPAGTPFEDLPDSYLCPVCGQQGKGKIGKWGFDEWRPTRWICTMCEYVYDEKRGEPHRGIKPGTKFEDLPDDYVCPVCALDPKLVVQFGKVFKQGFGPLYI
jgi:rubredoxin